MAEFPHMRFWTGDYLGDTTHLTTIEHGAYILLLITAWRSKAHCLPDDNLLLRQYAKLRSEQWKRIRPRLEPFFEITNGYWFHLKMLDEIESIRRQRNQKSNAGVRGALKRWNRSRKYGTQSAEPSTPLGHDHVRRSDPKPLKVLEPSMAAGVRLDSGAIANHSHTDKKEETEKEPEKVNGDPVVTEHLLKHIKQKGWVL